MTALDFSKSFSKCTYKEILNSYSRLNASQWLLDMHRAFLQDCTMSVKVGTFTSDPVKITGGAVQGSVLGTLDHNVVLEDLDDGLLDLYIAKYVDDIALLESVSKETPVEEDLTGSRIKHTIHPPKSQAALETIKNRAEQKSMLINTKKTQILTISSSHNDCDSYLTDQNGDHIPSTEELKCWGSSFQQNPRYSYNCR